MSREALVLLVCCCDFRDGAERLIPSKSLRNAVIWAFPGLLCILRMCAPRRAAAVVRPRGREKSADRRRRILISRLLIIRASVPRRKSPFPAYFKGFPAVSPLIPPYPAFLKYPVSPQFSSSHKELPMQRTKATSMPNSLIYRFFRNLAEYIFLRFYFVRAAQNILFYCTYSAPASISLFPFFTARISNQAFQILIAAYKRPLEPILACIFSLPSSVSSLPRLP